MAEKDPFEQFQKIPKHVRAALVSDDALRGNDIILTTYEIKEGQDTELFDIMRDVMILELPVEQLPQVIQERLELDEETAKRLAIDVVGLRLLPIQDWLGDVRQYIPKWGGKSDKYVERLQKMYSLRFAHRDLFDPIYSKHELGEFNVEMFERLDNLIISFVNGKRTEKEFEDVLQRGEDKGGMGFDEGKAVGFVKDINALIESEELTPELVNETKAKRDAVITAERIPGAEELMRQDIEVPESVKSQEEVEDAIRDPEEAEQRAALAEESPIAPSYKGDVKNLEQALAKPKKLSAPKTGLNLDLEEDEQEVERIGAEHGVTAAEVVPEELEAWVQAQADNFGVPQELVSRWVQAGTTYLKDIKSDFEFQDTLTRPVEEGGLGLSEDVMKKAAKMMKENKEIVMGGGKLEVAAQAVSEPVQEMQPKTMLQPEPIAEPAPVAEAPKPAFELPAEPEQDYFKTPEAPTMQPQAAPMANTAPQPPVATPPQAVSVPGPEPEAEEPKKHPERLSVPGEPEISQADIPNAPAAPAPKPAFEEAEAVIKHKAETLKVAGAKPEQAPAPEQPKQTKPRIIRPPEIAPGKTPVVEIQPPAPQITSPLDELRSMTLEIFRDLSVSPEEAKNILFEKISLFREQGIQRYTDAKLAWKASPLNQLSLEIGAQAFEEGKPIEQVLENRGKASQPTLQIEEFNAITDLNRELEQ